MAESNMRRVKKRPKGNLICEEYIQKYENIKEGRRS